MLFIRLFSYKSISSKMKKIITIILFSIIISGCASYENSDLNGRWRTLINDQYCELWIKNELVLDWNDALGDIRIRKFRIEGDNMIFLFPDKDAQPSDIEFILEITNLNNNSITTQILNHPDHPEHKYELIDRNLPDFNFDLYGSELYQIYRQELFDRGNKYKN